jgi:hypothetical protein
LLIKYVSEGARCYLLATIGLRSTMTLRSKTRRAGCWPAVGCREGLAGITMLHELVAEHLDPAAEPDQVLVGIETERGPWVQALLAAGYAVFAINPLQVARYRERHSPSGAKSDAADAHLLAEIVRLDRAHHRRIAGDSQIAEHVKIATRAHQSMIW